MLIGPCTNFKIGENNMTNIKSILIIEDDEIDRKALRRYLESERQDAEVVETHNCAEGFSAMAKKDFDCILLDY